MSRWRKATNFGGKGMSPSQLRKQQNSNGGRGRTIQSYPNRSFTSSHRRKFPNNMGMMQRHESQCPGYLNEVRSLSTDPSHHNYNRVMSYINSCPNKGSIRNSIGNIGGGDAPLGWLWCLCCMVSDVVGDGGACCECHRCPCKTKQENQPQSGTNPNNQNEDKIIMGAVRSCVALTTPRDAGDFHQRLMNCMPSPQVRDLRALIAHYQSQTQRGSFKRFLMRACCVGSGGTVMPCCDNWDIESAGGGGMDIYSSGGTQVCMDIDNPPFQLQDFQTNMSSCHDATCAQYCQSNVDQCNYGMGGMSYSNYEIPCISGASCVNGLTGPRCECYCGKLQGHISPNQNINL